MMSTEIAEIGQLKGVQATATQERERVSRGAGDAGGSRGVSTGQRGADEVRLSSSALKLRETARRLAEQPDVDRMRVAAIRDALSAGTYRVDPGRLADGILAQERQFLAGQGL